MPDNPYQPLDGTHTASDAPLRTRPTTATVFGILNLVFGAFGICGSIAGVLGMVIFEMPFMDEVIVEADELQIFRDVSYRTYMAIAMTIGTGLTIILIASGVGLLKFRPWGRVAANYYAVPQIIFVLGNAAYQIIWITAPDLGAGGEAGMQATFGLISQIFGAVFNLLYPILLLAFMNRKKFVDAIQSGLVTDQYAQ